MIRNRTTLVVKFSNYKAVLITKQSAVILVIGIQALLLWIGLPFYISGIGMQINHVVTLVLIIVFTISKLVHKDFRLINMPRPLFKYSLWIMASTFSIIVAATMSSINARNIIEVAKFQIAYLIGLLVLIVYLTVLEKKEDVDFILNLLILGGIFSVLCSFLGYFIPFFKEITFNRFGRAQGFLLHPNQLGIMLSSLIPISAATLSTKYHKYSSWLTMIILLSGVVISGSKTNLFISFTFGLLALLIINLIQPTSSQRHLSFFIMGFVVILSGIAALVLLQKIVPKSLQNLQMLLTYREEYRTLVIRREIWSAAVLLVQENNPFFGMGAGNTRDYLGVNHAHNVVIEYFFTMGYFGVIVLFMFLTSVFSLCLYSILISKKMPVIFRAQIIGLVLGICSYVLSNQLSESFGGTTLPILWVLIGALICKCKYCLQYYQSFKEKKL